MLFSARLVLTTCKETKYPFFKATYSTSHGLIQQLHPDKYKDCIVMLGIFHIMMYSGIMVKKY